MIYAVGDIHGQSESLDRALRLIEADGGAHARVVFVGDYTDRGLDVSGVVDRLLSGLEQGRNWVVLRGNHDRMFVRFVRDGVAVDPRIKSGKGWLHDALGGKATLVSYGVDLPVQGEEITDPALVAEIAAEARAKVPAAHIDFLASRALWHDEGGLRFVHAGLRPGVPMDQQDEDDLIWIRDGWLDSDADHGPLVVHGHTALDHPAHYGNRLNIDGGAGFGRPLVPVAIDGRTAWALSESGRAPIRPE